MGKFKLNTDKLSAEELEIVRELEKEVQEKYGKSLADYLVEAAESGEAEEIDPNDLDDEEKERISQIILPEN